MTDEKLFQYLVSRVHVRETSTLTIASIASSASLILLGLFLSPDLLKIDKEVIRWIGIITPILGLAYFEITFATQQTWDFHEINEMIKKDSKREKDELAKIIYAKNTKLAILKGTIWRVLLSLPIMGWFSIGGDISHIVLSIFLIGLAIFFLILRLELKKQSERTKFQNDSSFQDKNPENS